MKEFNMNAVKDGARIETADGRKARYIGEINNPVKPLVIAIDCNGVEHIELYAPNGKCHPERPDMDLVMSTVKYNGWVNVNNDTFYMYSKTIFVDREAAENEAEKANKNNGRPFVKTVNIEWEK